MSRHEQLEAARVILALNPRFLAVDADEGPVVTAEELMDAPIDEFTAEQVDRIMRAAKRQAAEVLWRTELDRFRLAA